MPEITVVITTYKLEKLLPKCLDRLLGGTFQDFNILIVDDCSPDGTADVIRQYEEAYPGKIKSLLLTQNMGAASKTRNAALDTGLVDGKYMIMLDGDDYTEPDFLEKLHSRAVETDADITMCGYDRVELENGHVLCREMQGFPSIVDVASSGDLLCFTNCALWNKLIRTEVIRPLRGAEVMVGTDLCFVYKIYANCRRVAFMDDILIHYQVRKGSVISNTSEKAIHLLAEEMERQLQAAVDPHFRQLLELVAFIHVGISMTLRAKDNPKIDLDAHLAWTREYLKRNGLLKASGYLTLPSLARHGIKGLGVWGCRVLHRLGCFRLFLWAYGFITKTLHIDIKF